MKKREQYKISFQVSDTHNGNIYYSASSTTEDSFDIANQLTLSSKEGTISQIEFINNAIDRAQKKLKFSDSYYSGEHFPPSFYISPADDIVEIGDGGTITPIDDFKQLLEEWLEFISI